MHPNVDPRSYKTKQSDIEELLNEKAKREELVIPVVEEYLELSKRTVRTSKVVITRSVDTREEIAGVDLHAQNFQVTRVAINRILEAPVEVRHEGETTIYPVMEETLVVVKQLVLKEEIHITRQQSESRHEEVVSLLSQRVSIERHAITSNGAHGNTE